jgi:hypothetical protein
MRERLLPPMPVEALSFASALALAACMGTPTVTGESAPNVAPVIQAYIPIETELTPDDSGQPLK